MISSPRLPSSPLLSAPPDESTTSRPPFGYSRVYLPQSGARENRLTVPTGVKAKVENKLQYDEYLKELEPVREELGISLREAMYPDKK